MGKKRLSTSKQIDGGKALKYLKENKVNCSEIGRRAGVADSYIRQAINHGYTNRVYWTAVCRELGVPDDYFDYVEPVPEPEPKEEPKEAHGKPGGEIG